MSINGWFDTRGKVIGWFIGVLAGIATIMVSWHQLGLPEIAFTPQITSAVSAAEEKQEKRTAALEERTTGLEQFSKGTRSLLLNEAWWRTKAKLDDLEDQIAKHGATQSDKELRLRYEQSMKTMESQIKELAN